MIQSANGRTAALLVALVLLAALPLRAQALPPATSPAGTELVSAVVPDGLGVNIHFTDPRPGEMAMLSDAGFRFVRMDFAWGGTERRKGQYDFSAYDRLLATCEKAGVRAMFILDYGNDLYAEGTPPATDEVRDAFAAWAAAAVRHFKGHHILWEMWNEPNGSFWKPVANADDYASLALATGRAIRAAEPGEIYVGPATSGVDLPFLETCFKAGLLEYWSAVSVHPYRQGDPETAADDYRKLRLMIAHYAPAGKAVPILSGEWGYSAGWQHFDETRQGKYLPRQWLTNLSNDVSLSIWYDWHDDGTDPKESEHHFGTVHHAYRAGEAQVFEPKPAYTAAKTLTGELAGYRFNKRLAVGKADEYVLLFDNYNDVKLAAWTTAKEPRPVTIPASAGEFAVVNYLGKALPALTAGEKSLAVTLGDGVVYLTPTKSNDLLRVAAAWDRLPLEVMVKGPATTKIKTFVCNPLNRAIHVRLGRSDDLNDLLPLALEASTAKFYPGIQTDFAESIGRTSEPKLVRYAMNLEGVGSVFQETQIIVTNPLKITPVPVTISRTLPVQIDNPSGDAFNGKLILTDVEKDAEHPVETPVELKAGQTQATIHLTNDRFAGPKFHFGLRLVDRDGAELSSVPAADYERVDDFFRPRQPDPAGPALAVARKRFPITYTLAADGDAKVASVQSFSFEPPPPGSPEDVGGDALKVTYRFERGWKFLLLAPHAGHDKLAGPPLDIAGRPKVLSVWVYGDASGSALRTRFVDSAGQTFQPNAGQVTWKGWRLVTIPLTGGEVGHWGGPNDGTIRYPIHWDALLLIDSARGEPATRTMYFALPTLTFAP